MNEIILIAKIGKTHGVYGKLNLYTLSSSVENVTNYKPLYIKYPKTNKWVSIVDNTINFLGKKLLIKFDNINTKEQATAFTNSFIGVNKKTLITLKKDEFYWFNIIGLRVISKEQYSFGKVSSIIDTKANSVLLCKKNNNQFLIPFVKKYIISINEINKTIVVDWKYYY